MNKAFRSYIFKLGLLGICLAGFIFTAGAQDLPMDPAADESHLPKISPDYTGVTLPPNIAPLNFKIIEPGDQYKVEIHAKAEPSIELNSKDGKIEIPSRAWRKLLEANLGQDLLIDISVKRDGEWLQFGSIVNHIAPEDIDPYVTYRLLRPVYTYWLDMKLCQRDITSFRESTILDNKSINKACLNCHIACRNDPSKVIFHVRGMEGSSMLVRDGKVSRFDTRTSFNKRGGSYLSWNPDGIHVAFAVIYITQVFHAVGETRDSIDYASDIIVYNIDTHAVSVSPLVADAKFMETHPEWSADGKYIYFCRAPQPEGLQATEDHLLDESYKDIKYDLMRIGYDVEHGTWGELETVLSAKETGMSIAMPRASFDGRFMLFNMKEYGPFPGFQNSDLYMLNLETNDYYPLDEVNSDQADSYHAWSVNSRWIMVASKRWDGSCTFLYFSYVDEAGKARKPFILPQKDPEFYETYLMSYNVPAFLTGPVQSTWQNLSRVSLHGDIAPATLDSEGMAPEQIKREIPESESWSRFE